MLVFVLAFFWLSTRKQDAFDQHVYMERWQRLPEGGGPTFAMRRRAEAFPSR